jgi:hypothetical protein
MINGGSITIVGVQSVSPAGSGNASNGLSVDPVTGDYVLGNDPGAVGNPAQLLNPREIFGNGFDITQRDSATEFTKFNGGSIRMDNGDGELALNPQSVNLTAVNPVALTHSMDDTNVSMQWGLNGNGLFTILSADVLGQIDPTNTLWQIGFGAIGIFNGSTAEVMGSITGDVFVDAKTANYLIQDAVNDRGKVFTNEGAAGTITFTLPAATKNRHYKIGVTDAFNVIVAAGAGDTINMNAVISSVAGNINSSTVGSFVHIYCLSAGKWTVGSLMGTWSIT